MRRKALSAKAPLIPLLGMLLLFLAVPISAAAADPIAVDGRENGDKLTGQQETWHDPGNSQSLANVVELYEGGSFGPLPGAGSTGLKKGAFWSRFALHNTTAAPLSLDIEYVDHQLIELAAFQRSRGTAGDYEHLLTLSMREPFDHRPVSHNRFIVPVELAPGETREFMFKFSSDEAGYVFPSMRIWTPDNLRSSHTVETASIAFLFGGFFLMSIFSLVGGIATGSRTYYAYSIYALSKITVWATILGYTHQYLIRDNFEWRYMSISGAVTILCGLVFARIFLQTRRFTPKLDRVVLLMMANASLLLIGALLSIKVLALITITLALLLYPVMPVVGLVRWRQGSREAIVFALAWSLLMIGLVVQAFRDLGYVEHNFINYYWPPFASFTEMLTIMAAIGIKVRRLRQEKQVAENQYRKHLERSKAELQALVWARTRELEAAKRQAEMEARTDPLTGIRNRRSFLADSRLHLKLAQRQRQTVSLLMFDIDHFKSINDTHGHCMGDEALRSFSETILGQIRETDIFGRLGGEEFGLLITEDRQNARLTAERLRDYIAKIRLNTGEDILQFTSSIGIACGAPGCTIETLLTHADRALYEAKSCGRNKVADYREEVTEQ
ncbi:diguanylate cyclase (GGDEF) domain-containing protein [Microbulbifer donghaiensis]|uniref:diguanylate cyclase n=1 Tax=Microbulbifer donghaiensis TaxID=494016 RepID=A0A1M5D4A8_9GAMM|nr:diguanylate cyclase [Microbulbifer donghaiensis]SHF61781.1 diguanylate cyclase (GGDEF) domain-containing protein [Microbulbifer donghaiensis]